jgi:hypothetical protein
MDLDKFKAQFPDEEACRSFFESVIWRNGRFCPRCHCDRSYRLSGPSVRNGLYECGECKREHYLFLPEREGK